MRHILSKKSPFVSQEVKKITFGNILTPVRTYGADCWAITYKDKTRIQAAEMKKKKLTAIAGKKTNKHGETELEMTE